MSSQRQCAVTLDKPVIYLFKLTKILEAVHLIEFKNLCIASKGPSRIVGIYLFLQEYCT